MDNVFVLLFGGRIVGVYTSHRKATQTMILDTLRKGWKLAQYQYDFGVEFYSYEHDGVEELYELQEVTPDARA
jgi:hypothetical protein